MFVAHQFVTSLRLRRRAMASIVQVGDERMRMELSTQPPVGATLDVGFPVLVTASKQVAGGGMLITAERIGEHDGF